MCEGLKYHTTKKEAICLPFSVSMIYKDQVNFFILICVFLSRVQEVTSRSFIPNLIFIICVLIKLTVWIKNFFS